MSSVKQPLDHIIDTTEAGQNGAGWKGACPVPGCPYPASIGIGDAGRILLSCVGGHRAKDRVGPLGLTERDLFPPTATGGEGVFTPSVNTATLQHPGLTLDEYAAAKKLPADRLRDFGLSDVIYQGKPAVRMPYLDAGGSEIATRYRRRLDPGDGDDRFRWKKGSKAVPYGQSRLMVARERGSITLVEGESDCHTLWHYGEPALGIPGVACWNPDRDTPLLDGFETVYVVREPDAAGDKLLERLADPRLRDRVRVVTLGEHKDPSALHMADPDAFRARWQAAKDAAAPLSDLLDERVAEAAEAARIASASLAHDPDILTRATETVAGLGVAGEADAVKLVYLAAVSRLLPRPVSAAVKGPSSAGKSFLVEQTLRLLPDDAYYALTAMSERALAYSDEPLTHRMLVIYEAAGVSGDTASYLLRSLLSEGAIRYETVEKTSEGLRARLIERPGPTGAILTTTATRLHPENETRLLSIPVSDTKEQTSAIFRTLAAGAIASPDLAPWHALQVWLASGPGDVALPFAGVLATLMPPRAVRLRRDFGLVLTLIRAHALLHRATRDVDDTGRIVATLDDYAAVRALVEPLIAAGVEATVPVSMRETVETVEGLLDGKGKDDTASVTKIAATLGLDKSAASRRVKAATDSGYLVNHEDKRGRPAKIALGHAMPADEPILPRHEELAECCSVAVLTEGINHHPPPPGDPSAGRTEVVL